MDKPELVFVAGCNAAGKSTFIRSRLDQLNEFEILMTDVYKGRTKELVRNAISNGKSIFVETVFNDESFKNLVHLAQVGILHLFSSAIFGQSGRLLSEGNYKGDSTKWYYYLRPQCEDKLCESFKNEEQVPKFKL